MDGVRHTLASMLLLASCSSPHVDPGAKLGGPVAPGFAPDRHCRMAMTFAAEGRCLAAGEQLAQCEGRLRSDARVAAETACPPDRAIETGDDPWVATPTTPPSGGPSSPAAPGDGATARPVPAPSASPAQPKSPRPQPPYTLPSALPPALPALPGLPILPGAPTPPDPLGLPR